MSWTEERIEVLSRLWLEGKSASQISYALGADLTRNAVIGKVHRLGLAGRVKPVDVPIPAPETPSASPPHHRIAACAAAAAPAVAIVATTITEATTVDTAPTITATLVDAKPAAIPQPAGAPQEIVVPRSIRVTIIELRESMCRWPLGDPGSDAFRYCGSQAHIGTPYCPYHGTLAYQPRQDRRRERERDRRPLLALAR